MNYILQIRAKRNKRLAKIAQEVGPVYIANITDRDVAVNDISTAFYENLSTDLELAQILK